MIHLNVILFDTKEADKIPSLLNYFWLSSKMQWLSGFHIAPSAYSLIQVVGTTKSNSNELPISVPLSFLLSFFSQKGDVWSS